MAKDNKKIIAIIIAIIILIFLFGGSSAPVVTINGTGTSGTSGSTGGGGGGSSSGTAPAPSGTGFTWPDFSNLFSFSIPCFFNCGSGTDSSDNSGSNLISDTRSAPTECSRSKDCNKCANPAYDTCSDGKCICAAPEQTNLWDAVRTIFSAECSRNSDCNKCSNPAYDTCTNGVCGCSTPVVVEATRTDLISDTRSAPTPECSRDSDCSKCANPTYDKCSSGSCVCQAPASPTFSCTDTDVRNAGDINYGIAGTCTGLTLTGNDFCSGDSLVEYSCVNNDCVGSFVSCSLTSGRNSFCMNGACVTLQ